MGVKVNKNGVVSGDPITESNGANILSNPLKYTITNPYVVTGTKNDIFVPVDMFSAVQPGATYYLTAKCSPGWSPSHGYADGANTGLGTIWLYFLKTYNTSSTGYDYPKCYHAKNWVRQGVWKVEVPNDVHMGRIRLNTYANGTDSVTAKFWDIKLIPQKQFVQQSIASARFCKTGEVVADDFWEV